MIKVLPHELRDFLIKNRDKHRETHGAGPKADREHLHEMLTTVELPPNLRASMQLAYNRHLMRERMEGTKNVNNA